MADININEVGSGKVVLLAGGGKCFTDVAARFVGSKKNLEDIIASEYDAKLVRNILNSGHLACTEFDNFVFGIEGYSRVTEVQLVRKRHASYIISSGRGEMKGKRTMDVAIPLGLDGFNFKSTIEPNRVKINNIPANLLYGDNAIIDLDLNVDNILQIIENFYSAGLEDGIAEEDLRYMKPQATTFKAIVSMNAHALIDWFKIRCCMKAQTEIRDLAIKMLYLCKEANPDLFMNAGPSCKSLGYCPENRLQHENCKGKVPTHTEVKKMINETLLHPLKVEKSKSKNMLGIQIDTSNIYIPKEDSK